MPDQKSEATLHCLVSLLRLNDDVLSLVTSHLMKEPSLVSALSISLVCKRTRRITLSFLFRAVHWPFKKRVDFFPEPLWPFIRQISLQTVQWRSHHLESLNLLSSVLPYLTNLTTFHYREQKFGPNPLFISTLADSSASLTTLELNTVFFCFDALNLFSGFSGIHRLLLRQPGDKTLWTAPESKRNILLRCVADLILACRDTLSHLELPGEFLRREAFSSLSAEIRLSALQTLILHGFPPLDAESTPIWSFMPFMPSLSKLEVLFKLRVIGARPTRYMLMPHDPPRVRGQVSVFSSLLDTLVIANPTMEDHVFLHIPSSLKNLTLDFVPEWENMLSSKDSLAYHRPGKMLSFLSSIQKSRSFMDPPFELQGLCIKMGWCATHDILRCICETFSDLNFLELQGLRYFSRAGNHNFEMDSYVSTLSSFQRLRTLKLAMELPEDPYEYSVGANRNVGSVEQAAHKWADALALRLPNLRSLAFETSPHVTRGAGSRILLGQAHWTWFEIDDGRAVRKYDMDERGLERNVMHDWGRKSVP